jgi:hypothetical protein
METHYEGTHPARSPCEIDSRSRSGAGGSSGAHERHPAKGRSVPGFVAGYWLEPADGQGSIVLFETEEQAHETAPPVSSWAAPGIVISGVEFRRVAATT